METVYKLRHKPTGLFFNTPDYILGNVSKRGKVFSSPPPRKSRLELPKELAEELNIPCEYYVVTIKTKLTDWEVVEFVLTEK